MLDAGHANATHRLPALPVGAGRYVVPRQISPEELRVIGEVGRRPGLPARRSRGQAVRDVLGRERLLTTDARLGERFRITPESAPQTRWRLSIPDIAASCSVPPPGLLREASPALRIPDRQQDEEHNGNREPRVVREREDDSEGAQEQRTGPEQQRSGPSQDSLDKPGAPPFACSRALDASKITRRAVLWAREVS